MNILIKHHTSHFCLHFYIVQVSNSVVQPKRRKYILYSNKLQVTNNIFITIQQGVSIKYQSSQQGLSLTASVLASLTVRGKKESIYYNY